MHKCKASSFKVQRSQVKCCPTSLSVYVPHAHSTMLSIFPYCPLHHIMRCLLCSLSVQHATRRCSGVGKCYNIILNGNQVHKEYMYTESSGTRIVHVLDLLRVNSNICSRAKTMYSWTDWNQLVSAHISLISGVGSIACHSGSVAQQTCCSHHWISLPRPV